MAGSLGSDSLALAEAQVGIALDSDGLTDSSAAGLHLDSANLENIYKTIMLSKRIKFQRSQKIIAIFASAMVAIGVIVVLISPR